MSLIYPRPQQPWWDRMISSITAIHTCLVGAFVSMVLGFHQLLLPNALFGEPGANVTYDQGVYYGAALRLTTGKLPYRDFTLVHPPGIIALLQPEALIGRLLSTGVGLTLSQIVTVFVVAANAFLAGYLVRSRGRAAALVASLAIALWPFTVHVNALVELEPYLVLFIFLAISCVNAATGNRTRRYLFLGGCAIGWALSVKAWGFYPLIALSGVVILRHRRRSLPFFAGFGAVIAVLWVPFLIVSGSAFIHDVLLAQLHRQGFIGTNPTPVLSRYLSTAGLADIFYGALITTSAAVAIAVYSVFAAGLASVFGLRWRNRTQAEWTILTVCLVTAIGVLTMQAPNFTSHYAYVPAAMFAPLLGILAASATGLIARFLAGESFGSVQTNTVAGALGVVVLACASIAMAVQVVSVAKLENATSFNPADDLRSAIAPNSCAYADFPSDLIAADRYLSTKPTCVALTDPFGMYLANDNGNQPHLNSPEHPIPPEFADKWFATVQSADYLVVSVPFTDYFPWDDRSMQWFSANFVLTETLKYPSRSGNEYVRYVYQHRQ